MMEDKSKNSTQPSEIDKFTRMPISKEFAELSLNEHDFYSQIRKYTILPEHLYSLGFPVDTVHGVHIFNDQFPFEKNILNGQNENKKARISDEVCPDDILKKSNLEQKCARCGTGFFLTPFGYLTQERCYYHYEKLKFQWGEGNQNSVYTCCNKPANSRGCSKTQLHVWSGLNKGVNNYIEGFVRTQPRRNGLVWPEIYAIDCEMCYTIKGMELCKVTVVDMEGRLIYNSFVQPEYYVIDFNTRFSGVTERDVAVYGKPLQLVQQDLLSFIHEETILVGHSLNNDSRALKILHGNFVDVSLIFPHERGYPYRYSLKRLVLHCLKKQIQSSEYGHNSFEDAVSCMELLLLKIVHEIRKEQQ